MAYILYIKSFIFMKLTLDIFSFQLVSPWYSYREAILIFWKSVNCKPNQSKLSVILICGARKITMFPQFCSLGYKTTSYYIKYKNLLNIMLFMNNFIYLWYNSFLWLPTLTLILWLNYFDYYFGPFTTQNGSREDGHICLLMIFITTFCENKVCCLRSDGISNTLNVTGVFVNKKSFICVSLWNNGKKHHLKSCFVLLY